jgi:HD-GYP domain-containing protein (c-di-GMP phosphodiesterase class II)
MGVWVLVMTCEHHTLYYSSIRYVDEGMFPHLMFGHGILYKLYMALVVTYFALCIFLLIRQYCREKRPIMKKQIFFLLLMMLSAVVGLALFYSGKTGGYDTTAVAYCISAVLFLVSITKYDLMETLELAKNYVMDSLEDGLVVLDSDGYVIYGNAIAQKIVPELRGKKLESGQDIEEQIQKEKIFFGDKVYQVSSHELFRDDKSKGRLCLFRDISDNYYYEEHLEKAVALQTRYAEERRRKVEQMSLQMVKTLADTIDAKDNYTKGHSARVAEYAVRLAKRMGYDEEQLHNLRYVALLHDLGKIGVPDAILNKPGRLSDIEYEIIKSHPTVGGDILKNVGTIPGLEDAARHHHERYDGSGYPDGLKGEEIPEVARIVGIADAYDAMNSKRVYRKALSMEKIREELVRGRGTQFDPKALDLFLELLDEGKLDVVTVWEEKRAHSQDDDRKALQKVDLDQLVQKLQNRGEYEGALGVEYDEFARLYEYTKNFGKRYGQDFDLAMITLDMDSDTDSASIEVAMKCMEQSIQTTIRNVDICTRYGNSRFLIILLNVGHDNVNLVINRIFEYFYKIYHGKRVELSYCVAKSLSENADEEK